MYTFFYIDTNKITTNQDGIHMKTTTSHGFVRNLMSGKEHDVSIVKLCLLLHYNIILHYIITWAASIVEEERH